MIIALIASGVGMMVISSAPVTIGYAVAVALYAAAAAVFADVSWRHWPARVFALPEELASFRRGLTIRAWMILCLVSAAFVTALSVSVGAGS